MISDDQQARKALRQIFDAAVGSADPALIVPRHLPTPPKGRCVVIGAGKASAGNPSDARVRGRNAEAARHDSLYGFQAIGDLVVTGPTLTNINDIRAILISGS